MHSLDQLTALATGYALGEPYVRLVLSRDANLEVALIVFRQGQTSTVHDHRGSNCVVRVLQGTIRETLFDPPLRRLLTPGALSTLPGDRRHQIEALTDAVLLNFYSPPFGDPSGRA